MANNTLTPLRDTLSDADLVTLDYAPSAYSHLLPQGGAWMTSSQFADRIAEVYAQRVPQVAAVIEVLKRAVGWKFCRSAGRILTHAPN